jgi:hypothetical protein
MIELNKNRAIVGIIGLVVLASGCTNTGGGTSDVSYTPNTGVTVEEFSAFPTQVFSGDGTDLSATLRNTGEVTARHVTLQITNVPFGTNPGWTNDDGSGSPQLFGTGTDLSPGNPDTGVPPSPVTDSAALTAPSLGEGVTISYDFVGELAFDYRTEAVSEIEVVSESQYRQQGLSRGQPSVDNSAAPVKIGVRSSTPIIVQDDDGTISSPICVTVRNSGSGVPTLNAESNTDSYISNGNRNPDEALNKVELTVNFPGLGSSTSVVELRGNSGVECFEFGSNGAFSQPTDSEVGTTYPVQITANYRYEKDTSTSVTVQGQQ